MFRKRVCDDPLGPIFLQTELTAWAFPAAYGVLIAAVLALMALAVLKEQVGNSLGLGV